MNNRGSGSGLSLALFLIVALIIAFLAMKQMSSLGIGGATQQEQMQQAPVEKAQDAVDAVNERMLQSVPEEEP